MLLVSVFLFLITIAVPIYIYAGMQKEKYDSKSYNRENAQDPSSNAMREKNQRWGGVIMLSATAVFLLLGFCWNLWQYSWVAFPLAEFCVQLFPVQSVDQSKYYGIRR